VVAELPDAAFRGGREASAGGDAVRIVTGAPPRAGEPLAGARREADWLRERYAGASRWSAAGRTPQAALSAMRGAAVLHVTGHAELDDRHPWRSGLVLAAAPDREPAGVPAPVPRPAAGPAPPAARSSPPTPARWLTADAIAAGRLDARMAVLSSCATGAGLALKGEGVASLASAFLVAGVPTVVATRWPVDDAATERLMRAFYAELEAGRTAGEALARARERLRRDPPTAHPFYWAGFVLTGDPDTRLALRARPLAGARVALYLVGGLLVGGALALWRRRRLETGGHRGPPAV
jgi:CHAT domain-containing protein